MTGMFLKAEMWVANVLLAAIVLLVFVAGIARWFGQPLVWSVDLAQLLFVWVSFLGADMALRRRAHIGIDYLVRRLPGGSRVILDSLLAALCVAFLGVMAVLGYQLTMLNLERLYGDSGIPYALVTIAVPFGCGLLALTLLGQAWASVSRLRTEARPIFSGEGRSGTGELQP